MGWDVLKILRGLRGCFGIRNDSDGLGWIRVRILGWGWLVILWGSCRSDALLRLTHPTLDALDALDVLGFMWGFFGILGWLR